ncbi:uncharacterized protein [Montipora foliosa]|uniref:uncharacterized protein n=1 Tax=Montipora foliosa TaxID=591990 RepID=UPI0035F1931B
MLKKDQCWRCDAICSVPAAKINCDNCEVAYYCSDKCRSSDSFRHQVDCQTASLKRKCSGCGKEKPGLKPCGSCRQVWYCNTECQKKSWPTHKALCQQVTKATNELSDQLKVILRLTAFIPGHATVYYWGNTPAVDLINLPLNEGCNYSKPLSVLICGVGDPRNVVLSLSQLPESYQEELTFLLNDICACTLARTVLLLYLLLKGGEQAATSVAQIWYSLQLKEEDYQLVTHTLKELIGGSCLEELTGGTMKMDHGHFKRITEVWRTWLQLSSRKGDWITQARHKCFENFDAREGMQLYLEEIPEEHRKSASEYFANGILSPKGSPKELPRENVTLTGSDLQISQNKGDFTYIIQSSVTPFSGWDYKEVSQCHHSASILKMYSGYVSHELEKCALRLTTGKVKFHFLLCNCLEIDQFLSPSRKYDRVTTSNIADSVPLTSILDRFKPLLNLSNPSSVIITQFHNWVKLTDLMSKARARADSLPGGDSFRQKVFEDTRNRAIAESTAYQAFMDYHDHSPEFIKFLRAALLISNVTDKRNQRTRRTWQSVADHNGLVARNFLRCQNRVFPAKWMLNCRRVTMLNGFERNVEWVVKGNLHS